MTLVALPSPDLFPNWRGTISGAPAFATIITLDAAGEYLSYIFQAPLGGLVLSHIGFMTGTVAGAPTADVRVETIDAATGFPSGTLWATNTNVVSGTLVSSTWTLVALTASATINALDFFAVKVLYNSGTSIILRYLNQIQVGTSLPYLVDNTGGSPAKSSTSMYQLLALGSSATAFYNMPSVMPVSAITSVTFNNTNGARRGMRIKIPTKCTVAGMRLRATTQTGACNIALFSDAGAELNNSSSLIDPDITINIAAAGMHIHLFDNAVDVDAGTWVRAVMEPTSATNCGLTTITLPSANYRSAMPGGADCHYTTYASSAWDDTPTDQVPIMDLIISHRDDGAGAGGGLLAHPGMRGGMI